MSVPQWPGTVPTSPLLAGFNQEYESFNAEFQPDAGLPNTWPRSSVSRLTTPMSMFLTAAERTALVTFWKTTTVFGSKAFDILDVVSNTTVRAKFSGGLSFNANGGIKPWLVQFQLIRLD